MGQGNEPVGSWQGGDTVAVPVMLTHLDERDKALLSRVALHLREEVIIALGRASVSLKIDSRGICDDCDTIELVADWLEDAIKASEIRT